MSSAKDEFYCDILEGLALYTGSALQRDVLTTLSRHDEPRLGAALNKNQMASKMWLADSLLASAGSDFSSILILGGWMGVLGAVLLHDPRFTIAHVLSIDVDPWCAALARSLNATHAQAGRFEAQTADMRDIDYRQRLAGNPEVDRKNLVINTSCEHLSDFGRWYEKIPAGQLLSMQSNDYYACPEHVNCVSDLATFAVTTPMREVLYSGERPMRRYTRFMRIGRK